MWRRAGPLVAACPPGARAGHIVRGKPPSLALTLRQRLELLDKKDSFHEHRTDIGLPFYRKRYCEEHKMRQSQLEKIKSNPELEKSARNCQIRIDIEKVEKEWLRLGGPGQIHKIAEHYGIFKDLYDEGYFVPRVPMKILFDGEDDILSPVYHGNVIKPAEAKNAPSVMYESEDDTLWTIVLCNPDGHLTEPGKEYVHWFVANIPGNDLEKGETLIKYMQPIPPKGTGCHRYIFVLYKQTKMIEYDITKVTEDCLQERTFITRDWYSKYQDFITPAGLSFFQSDWDSSLTSFYHNNLNMTEPIYEYDFEKRYVRPQEYHPLRQPFNTYMDKYRDIKQINKEYLLKELKTSNPFKKPDPPLKFPVASYSRKVPSWLLVKEKKDKLKWGHVNCLD